MVGLVASATTKKSFFLLKNQPFVTMERNSPLSALVERRDSPPHEFQRADPPRLVPRRALPGSSVLDTLGAAEAEAEAAAAVDAGHVRLAHEGEGGRIRGLTEGD